MWRSGFHVGRAPPVPGDESRGHLPLQRRHRVAPASRRVVRDRSEATRRTPSRCDGKEDDMAWDNDRASEDGKQANAEK